MMGGQATANIFPIHSDIVKGVKRVFKISSFFYGLT
jgi:hypothetical protein